jgi:hypothetical protein
MSDSIEVKETWGIAYYNHKKEYHRTNGPAVIPYDQLVYPFVWFNNGVRHRIDGPAVVYGNGYSERYWFVYGTEIEVY